MDDGMPPDPFDPHGDYLKAEAFTAAQLARELLAAAQALGLDTTRYHLLVRATTAVNAHFHPSVRLQHGAISQRGGMP